MENLYKDLKKQLKTKGINIMNTDYYENIEYWKSWYAGFVDGFHNYIVKLADGTTAEKERLTMNMPKKVCEDRAKLVWSENVKITLDDEEKTAKLWEILDSKKNNFSVMMSRMLELAYALGTTGFTEFKDKNGDIIIEYIDDAMNIVPYKYDLFNIYGMCVLDTWQDEEKGKPVYYTHITYHEFENGTYTKLNEVYKSKDPNSLGKEINFNEIFPDVQEAVKYENIETPHFQIYRPNIANNFDTEIPLGLSVLANSIDRFKAIDIKYDGFTNEFESGKKRILVDRTALKSTPQIDEAGNITQVVYFDKDDDTYVAINGMENQPVKEIDFNLRTNEYITSLNNELSWLGANTGFGESYYSLEGSRVKTATEVLSEDSDAFRTMRNDTIILKDVVYDLVKAVCELAGIDTKTINIETDMSRFVDKDKEIQRYQYELANGLMTKESYLMKVYNIDEEDAKKIVADAKTENPSVKDLLGTDTNE